MHRMYGMRGLYGLFVALALLPAGCQYAPAEGLPKTTGEPAAKSNGEAGKSGETSAAAPTIVYDVMYINGAKVGVTETRYERLRELGRDQVKITSRTRMAVKRFGDTTSQEIQLTSVETPTGELVRFETIMKTGPNPTVVRGQSEAGRLRLETTIEGKPQTQQLAWKPSWGGFFAVEQSLQKAPMQPGEKRQLTQLFPALNQVAEVLLHAQEYEKTKMLDGELELLKVKHLVTLPGNQKLDWTVWCDRAGETIKTDMGGQQLSFRTTRERAERDDGAAPFDLGSGMVVKVNRRLDNPHGSRRIVYKARVPGAEAAEIFQSSLTQTVKPLSADTVEITVQVAGVTEPKEVPPGLAAPPSEDDLRPNNYLQSDDPRVIRLAQRVAVANADPWQIAVAFEQTVKNSLRNKNFSQAFATAAETAESLEGDCTEHAMLLAALCRVRKIPSRVATGLVYYPPQSGFAYHMWTEVWTGDRWLPLDATLGRGGIGAAHIKLAESNLQGADALGTFLPVARVMNRLELEIMAVE